MKNNGSQFLVGTSGWSYPHWQGVFYPEDLPKSRWFEYYIQKFATVEINATFYRFFKDQTYVKWHDNAPKQFKYVLKAPRLISHRKYLKDAADQIKAFWQSANLLKNKLGLILLQLAPGMPYDPERLRQALLTFKIPGKVAVEFRHKKWFTEETRDLLKEVGAIFCTADSPKTKLMDWVTSNGAYIRLHGRKQWYSYNYSKQELTEIAELANRMAEQGAKKVYIFFNNDFGGYAPKNAITLLEMLEG
jgi:uncharacterized protein YecE (DUF72 family)